MQRWRGESSRVANRGWLVGPLHDEEWNDVKWRFGDANEIASDSLIDHSLLGLLLQ